MEVPVSQFRAELKSWIAAAQEGETVVITDRGVPVAQLAAVGAAGLIQDLKERGQLAVPSAPRTDLQAVNRVEERPNQPLVSGLVRRLRR